MATDFLKDAVFGEVIDLISHKIKSSEVSLENYISTENMLPNCGGITIASSLPNANKFNEFCESDTLFSNIRTYFRKVWFADFTGGASADVLIFRTKNISTLDPQFLYYLVSNKTFVDFTDRTSKGAKMPRGDKDAIIKFLLKIPPIADQKAITHILGTLDDKIEVNQKMNETLEEMARAVFKSWFVDFDPVRAKMEGRPTELPDDISGLFPNELVDSEIGQIPKGWTKKPLDEAADFLNGAAMQKFPAEGTDFLPVIKIAELRNGISSNTNRASPDVAEKYVIFDGDVLFAWSASLMQKIWTGGKGALNQHLFKVTSKDYEKWFFYYWIDHHMQWFRSIAASKATTMGHIQRTHLKEAKVIVPSKSVREIGNKVIAPLLEKQTQNSLESHTLAELRDTLLPKLISGEIRVKDAERKMEAAI